MRDLELAGDSHILHDIMKIPMTKRFTETSFFKYYWYYFGNSDVIN